MKMIEQKSGILLRVTTGRNLYFFNQSTFAYNVVLVSTV